MPEHGSGLIREGGQTRNCPSGRGRSPITATTGCEGDSRAALVCCAALGVSGNMLSQTSQNINLLFSAGGTRICQSLRQRPGSLQEESLEATSAGETGLVHL